MARKRLTPYDRLPPYEKEIYDEWNATVFRYEKGPDGFIRSPKDSAPRLAALYDKCRNETGWCVSARTAETIAGSSAGQAMCDGDWNLAIEVWNCFLTHPKAATTSKLSRVISESRHAAAHFMTGEIDTAVAMWLELLSHPTNMKVIFRRDVAALCEILAEANPGAKIEPRLLPVLVLLKCRSQRLREISDGTRQATYAEIAELLEAVRAREGARHKAKLGKPKKHAS